MMTIPGNFVPSVLAKNLEKPACSGSHIDSEHQDDRSPPVESNMAAVDVPLGVPAVTTVNPITDSFETDDPIDFQGAWCASVAMSDVARAFGKTVTNDDICDDDTITDAVFDESPPLMARPVMPRDVNCLSC
jgi:hypothetical protein